MQTLSKEHNNDT